MAVPRPKTELDARARGMETAARTIERRGEEYEQVAGRTGETAARYYGGAAVGAQHAARELRAEAGMLRAHARLAHPDRERLRRDALTDTGEFGVDVAWSPSMAAGHRIDLDGLDAEAPAGVDEAQLRAVARRQVRRVVDADGRPRGWLLFGQLRPELTARLVDLHLQQRHNTTLTAEIAAGRVGDHLRLASAPASARPPLDPDIRPRRWPVTVLDARPTQSLAM